MPEYFKVGKQCACIQGGIWGPHPASADTYGPRKHEIVTVSAIMGHDGGLLLMFDEYDKQGENGGNYAYGAECFRPLDESHFGGFGVEIFEDEHERLDLPTTIPAGVLSALHQCEAEISTAIEDLRIRLGT